MNFARGEYNMFTNFKSRNRGMDKTAKIAFIMFLTVISSMFLNPGSAQASGSIASCAGCHDNPPVDGTRSAATGAFPGSHTEHSGPAQYNIACTVCHYDNGAFPTGDKHSN